MKTIYTFLLMLLMIPFVGHAQENMERIKALKVGYLTRELDLTPAEAKAFWPVYDAHEERMHALRKEQRQERHQNRGNFDEMSDSEVADFVEKRMESREAEVREERAFLEEVRAVLPIRKVAKLFKAEHEFRKMLLNNLKGNRGGGGAGRRGGGPRGF